MPSVAPDCVAGGCGCQSRQSPVQDNHHMTDRHNGGANLAFLDGHVKWMKITVPSAASNFRSSDPPIAMFYGQ